MAKAIRLPNDSPFLKGVSKSVTEPENRHFSTCNRFIKIPVYSCMTSENKSSNTSVPMITQIPDSLYFLFEKLPAPEIQTKSNYCKSIYIKARSFIDDCRKVGITLDNK